MSPSGAAPPPALSARRALRLLVGALAALAALLPPTAAQDETAPALPPEVEGEGRLANDVFLPLSDAGCKALAEGDQALGRARAAGAAPGDVERERSTAFDAWLRALSSTAGGEQDLVGAGDPVETTPRLARGVEDAVLARIASLSDEERAAWRARAGPLAAAALARASAGGGSALVLADLERAQPATLPAAEAALRLADRALEEGRRTAAAGWLSRARAHARLAALGADWDRALARRAATLAAGASPARPEAWRTATGLRPAGTLAFPGDPGSDPVRPARGPDGGVRPGALALADGRLVLQTPERIVLLRESPQEGLVQDGPAFEPAERLGELLGPTATTLASPLPPGWRLVPAARGRRLVFVQGRDVQPDGPANALAAFDLPSATGASPLGLLTAARLPQLAWAVRGDQRVQGSGEPAGDPALAGLESAELEPGPAIVGSLVLLQARVYASSVESWALAFDLETGALVWKRRLAVGSDVTPDSGRLGSGPRLSAEPPLVIGEQVFLGTHLGAGVLVDAWDGRVRWALQDRRRDAAVAGWGGSELALSGGSAGPEVAWAPADSDRLYRLAVLPPEHARIAAADLFRAAPMPVDGALSLVGAGERGALVLAAEGGERGLVLRPWDEGADGAHRIRSLWLGPAEEFSGRGLASAERALFATDRGLYLFDRARELYLADYEPLAPLRDATRGSAPSAGGDVFATRDLVLVVGPEGAWIFRVE